MGCTVPISLFTAEMLTSIVSLSTASLSFSRLMNPSLFTGILVVVKPNFCIISATCKTLMGSISDMMIFLPLLFCAKHVPIMARLLASVSPGVKVISSRFFAPMVLLIFWKQFIMTSKASQPGLCVSVGLPYAFLLK